MHASVQELTYHYRQQQSTYIGILAYKHTRGAQAPDSRRTAAVSQRDTCVHGA